MYSTEKLNTPETVEVDINVMKKLLG